MAANHAAGAAEPDLATHASNNPGLNQRIDRLLVFFNQNKTDLVAAEATIEEQKEMIGVLETDLQASLALQASQQIENRGRINHRSYSALPRCGIGR